MTDVIDQPDVAIDGGDLEKYDGPPATLFGTSNPRVALEHMAEIARTLVDVIRNQKLSVRISGHEHLTAEAWTTLGGMLGITPVVEWSRPLADGTGWEARVQAVRVSDGRVVGAGESMCSRSESTWAKRDEFALRSMAQTRAVSRALRAPLGQVVTLAGFAPAAAEEMSERAAEGPPAASAGPTSAQREEIGALLGRLSAAAPAADWQAACVRAFGPAEQLSAETAGALIVQLRSWLGELEVPQ
jgi:hypothetical protein